MLGSGAASGCEDPPSQQAAAGGSAPREAPQPPAASLAAAASLEALPDELLTRTLRMLPLVSRLRASAVSRRFKRLLYTPELRAAFDPAHVLPNRRSLARRHSLRSPDGRFLLVYQHDANLVFHFCREGQLPLPIWAMQTVDAAYWLHAAGQLTMRNDGVAALNARYWHQRPTYWESARPAHHAPPYRLAMRNEGDFAVIDADDAVVWAAVPAPLPAEH